MSIPNNNLHFAAASGSVTVREYYPRPGVRQFIRTTVRNNWNTICFSGARVGEEDDSWGYEQLLSISITALMRTVVTPHNHPSIKVD